MKNFFLKNWKISVAVLVLAIIALVVYMGEIKAWMKRKAKVTADMNKAAANGAATGVQVDSQKVLQIGDHGAEVKALQNAIIAESKATPGVSAPETMLPKYGADGIFGKETENALFAMRKVKKISLADFMKGSATTTDTAATPGAAGAKKTTTA